MYKNRISRTTSKRQPQFFIRRSEIAFEERTAYVESVLAVLIESRFGFDCVAPVTIVLSDRSAPEPAVFFDLSEQGMVVPCHGLSTLGRKGYQVVEAEYRRAKQMGLLDAMPNARNSTTALQPNQGRGSP